MPPALLCQILTPPQPVCSDSKIPYDIAVEYHMDGLSNLRRQADGSRHCVLQVTACASETLKEVTTTIDSLSGEIEKQTAAFAALKNGVDASETDSGEKGVAPIEIAYIEYIQAVSDLVRVAHSAAAAATEKPDGVEHKPAVEAFQRLDLVVTDYVNHLLSADAVSPRAQAATDRASAAIHRAEFSLQPRRTLSRS